MSRDYLDDDSIPYSLDRIANRLEEIAEALDRLAPVRQADTVGGPK